MNKDAVRGMLRVAQDLLNAEPEMSKAIVKNLRGLIDESRVASPMPKLKDLIKEAKDLLETGKASAGKSISSGSDLSAKDHKIITDFLEMAEEAVKEHSDETVPGFIKGANPDEVKLLKAFNALVTRLHKEAEASEPVELKKTASVNVATLVRVAFEHPETRSVLLPIIAAKTSKKKPAKKSSAKPAKKVSEKMDKKTSKKSETPAKASKKPEHKATKKPVKKSMKRKASIDLGISDSNW